MTISCALAVSRSNSRHRIPTSPPRTGERYFVIHTSGICSPKRYGCLVCTLPSSQSTWEALQSQPPKGVGFPDPLSGTLNFHPTLNEIEPPIDYCGTAERPC